MAPDKLAPTPDVHRPLDVIWGAENIAQVIDLPVRAVYRLLEGGNIPARKVGRKWAITRTALEAAFVETGRPYE